MASAVSASDPVINLEEGTNPMINPNEAKSLIEKNPLRIGFCRRVDEDGMRKLLDAFKPNLWGELRIPRSKPGEFSIGHLQNMNGCVNCSENNVARCYYCSDMPIDQLTFHFKNEFGQRCSKSCPVKVVLVASGFSPEVAEIIKEAMIVADANARTYSAAAAAYGV